MPPVGEAAGWRVYVYKEQRHKLSVSLSPDGEILGDSLPPGDARVIREWTAARREAIIQAFRDVRERRLPQWIP